MIIVKDNYFHLLTDKTSYVFMINEAGLPEHGGLEAELDRV